MAVASMKAIKGRIKSVRSTMQITKAMELVAASKLRHAKEQEESTKPFYRILADTIADITSTNDEPNRYFIETDDTLATCYVVIAGDRGLAGGYNNNLFRMVREIIREGDSVLPVGKKSVEYYARSEVERISEQFTLTADVGVPDALEIGKLLCDGFCKKRYGHVVLVYTEFINMLTQNPVMVPLLPLDKNNFRKDEHSTKQETVYEPSPSAVLNEIVPGYVSGMVYGAVCEAFASECAARRNSMSAANKNAGAMIDRLTLNYNRARQAMITQEITEIVAGSEL